MRSCSVWSIYTRFAERLLFAAFLLSCCGAWAQQGQWQPHIGYVYPAGAQQGSVTHVIAGGQYLRGANLAPIVGDGVRASVVGYIPHYKKPLNREEMRQLVERLADLKQERSNETETPLEPSLSLQRRSRSRIASTTDTVKPDHPLLRDVELMNLRELEYVSGQIGKSRDKQQRNEQIAEIVLLDVTVDDLASPGEREIRLVSPAGLSNPLRFHVGQLPEVSENEPNDTKASEGTVAQTPVMFNGQILPGDVDRFRLRAKQGDSLVIEAYARRLIPYLADAVPGWFQAVLALYDSSGSRVAFADDFRFDPDPVILYKVPKDGEYELEIRDAIYRGREDFIYRISVSAQPFITSIYPLGARSGEPANVLLTGWNLPVSEAQLETQPGASSLREIRWNWNGLYSNPVAYAVDTLAECEESEPNDTRKESRFLTLPTFVNGCISRRGDVDTFRFVGHVGDRIVAEVNARKLHSPLDSVLRLTDKTGKVIASNDDREDNRIGLQTHQADSYLSIALPEEGTYYLEIADTQKQGGKEYGYRLRVSSPRPDFELMATPSSLFAPAACSVPVTVHALRTDGFDGEIEVVLKDTGHGFKLSGGLIPPDKTSVRITLTAPENAPAEPVSLILEGRATPGGQMVTRPVVAADDLMQAFAYQHLVPAQRLMALVKSIRWRVLPVSLVSALPIQIPEGGTASVRLSVPRRSMARRFQCEIKDPSKGVTLDDVNYSPGVVTLTLKADRELAKSGIADNLIVEVFTEWAGNNQEGKPTQEPRKVSLGVLPAIPFEIVSR